LGWEDVVADELDVTPDQELLMRFDALGTACLQLIGYGSPEHAVKLIVSDFLRRKDPDGKLLAEAARNVLDRTDLISFTDRGKSVASRCRMLLLGDDVAVACSRFSSRRTGALEHGPGWYEIVVKLDRDPSETSPDVRYLQIKEKFGTLRVYAENTDEKSMSLIEAAERASETTCEECGLPGRLRGDRYYVQTLCDIHAKERL
jgi:hypothetical protein